ncbi:hypothetical protein GCM10009096_27800 [Parasphingorhabdus litoris]|uniref:Uncharacterized protein n=1 Tax=Parasphingorhabdus litoris TaxID=394733 RepID=A0ABP3KQP9_9SPHN
MSVLPIVQHLTGLSSKHCLNNIDIAEYSNPAIYSLPDGLDKPFAVQHGLAFGRMPLGQPLFSHGPH